MTRTPKTGHDDLFTRLRAMAGHGPPDPDNERWLLALDDPENGEQQKDRFTALIAAGAVERALCSAIKRQCPSGLPPKTFDAAIRRAEALKIVTPGQAIELHKLRLVRNAFAHSLAPIGFDAPDIKEATKGLWDHPVSSWAGYFAPAFDPRQQFAIVCEQFYWELLRAN